MSNPEVHQIVSAAAAELRNICIRKINNISLSASDVDRVLLAGPPVLTDYYIGSVDLSRLAPAVYGVAYSDDVFDDLIKAARSWGHSAEAGARMRQAVIKVAGELPVTKVSGASPMAVLIQVLGAMTWDGRCQLQTLSRFTRFTNRRGEHWEFYDQALEGPDGYRRLPQRLGVSFRRAIDQPLGWRAGGHGRTGALLRFLHKAVPEHRQALNSLFCAAVYTRCEDKLQEAFDITYHSDVFPGKVGVIWQQAINAVQRSDKFEPEVYWSILEGICTRRTFFDIFGPPNRWANCTLSTAVRNKCLRLLENKRLEAISTAVGDKVQQPDLSALEALELQQMIR